MDNKISFDKEKNLILIYNERSKKWEDKTSSIKTIFKAFYYGNFSGYNVYYTGDDTKFFYKANKVMNLQYIKSISFDQQDVIVSGKIVDAISIDAFQLGFYCVRTQSKTIITKDLQLKNGQYKNILQCYKDLAAFAEEIACDDEPIYFLAKIYPKIELSTHSVLYSYLNGSFHGEDDKHPVITPFDFNQSQIQALQRALNNNISVVEGPPGTGKTQTILNMISNILSRKLNCAVISNNNTAIANVYDKLSDENLSFVAAKLGSLENVENFFDNNQDDLIADFLSDDIPLIHKNIQQRINELFIFIKRENEARIKLARLNDERNHVNVELKNRQVNSDISHIKMTSNLKSVDYITLIHRLEKEKKTHFFERLRLNFIYKTKLNKFDANDLIEKAEEFFYKMKIEELNNKISRCENEIKYYERKGYINELKMVSKNYIIKHLHDYYSSIKNTTFHKDSYKGNYQQFVSRYPVILSTSNSLFYNVPKGFLFDYLIIDEASQGDLLSNIVAMSCAKKIIVVGDSNQLQQIDEVRLYKKATELESKYQIPNSYKYKGNSILKSIRESIQNVPITLLKEHYRCAPDIINFCNKMFYDEFLIPMTSNTGQHLQIIKTVEGNHGRKNPNGSGMYNSREIDEICHLIEGKDVSQIGVITPFRYQANMIRERIADPLLEIDTVHKYQGRQKNEIIMSFVVNSLVDDKQNIENRLYDFITNEKLLNVAISRGKDKVTAIVSDKVYHSQNNIIHDFIKYTENLYGDSITKTSSITSVFDYLYAEYDNELKKKFNAKPHQHKTELLMCELIDDVLNKRSKFGYSMHVRLSKIINSFDTFDETEIRYLKHPWTHVDFLFFNRITKEKLFVLEVDGIRYHEQSQKQSQHDEIKDRALTNNKIPIYRFKTNESNERNRLTEIIEQFEY